MRVLQVLRLERGVRERLAAVPQRPCDPRRGDGFQLGARQHLFDTVGAVVKRQPENRFPVFR
jgi:hypothetical protein